MQAIFLIPKPLGRAVTTQPSDEIARILTNFARELQNIHTTQYNIVCLHCIIACKWRAEEQ
jgi:hypothetical protein